LYDSYDKSVSPANANNESSRSRRIPSLLCPTDSYNSQPFMGAQGTQSTAFGDNWARNNYACNSSLGSGSSGWWWSGSSADGWADVNRRGMMGFNVAVSPKQITDGLSKTVMLAEIRSGVTAFDPRGVWALGLPGSSSLWTHGGIYGDAYGPNCPNAFADDICNCDLIKTAVGGEEALAAMLMGCWDNAGNSMSQGTARSLHVGGVFVSMADGSVRWVTDMIQVLPSTPANLSVWDRLMLSADGQVVPADAM